MDSLSELPHTAQTTIAAAGDLTAPDQTRVHYRAKKACRPAESRFSVRFSHFHQKPMTIAVLFQTLADSVVRRV